MSALCIQEFDELLATIVDAEKRSDQAKCDSSERGLSATLTELDRQKARADAARERLKYYTPAALLATLHTRQAALEAIVAIERPRDSHPTTQHALMRERFTQVQEIARDALEAGPPPERSQAAQRPAQARSLEDE